MREDLVLILEQDSVFDRWRGRHACLGRLRGEYLDAFTAEGALVSVQK
jgi:hypothetical protein